MYQMTDAERTERAKQKALHQAIRAAMRDGHREPYKDAAGQYHGLGHAGRYYALAWAFVRGFPYRRVERSHHKQTLPDGSVYEHNLPSTYALNKRISEFVDGVSLEQVTAWVDDPSGAIPTPAPRPKRPYVAQAPAAE
jgi:hypothetical protein